jgi:hypothetical protein
MGSPPVDAGLLTERAQEATTAFGEHSRRRSADAGAVGSYRAFLATSTS